MGKHFALQDFYVAFRDIDIQVVIDIQLSPDRRTFNRDRDLLSCFGFPDRLLVILDGLEMTNLPAVTLDKVHISPECAAKDPDTHHGRVTLAEDTIREDPDLRRHHDLFEPLFFHFPFYIIAPCNVIVHELVNHAPGKNPYMGIHGILYHLSRIGKDCSIET